MKKIENKNTPERPNGSEQINAVIGSLKGFNKNLLEYMDYGGELEYFATLPRIDQLKYAKTTRESIGYQKYVAEKEMKEFIDTLDMLDSVYWIIKLKLHEIKIWIRYELPKYLPFNCR